MAPTITGALTRPQEDLTLAQKLRKPAVEKLRRERINSSIEQLKSLLGPDSKIEKADILEMTVSILRQLQRRRCTSDFTNVDHGCPVQETKHFIYKEGTQVYTQRRLTGCLNRWNPSSDNSLAEIDLSPLSSTAVQHSKSPESSQQRPVEAMVDTYTWVEMVSVKSCQKPSVVS